MTVWYTINGLSGTPRREIVDFMSTYFLDKKKKVVCTADPTGTQYGRLVNDIIVKDHLAVSSFTEVLLYLTASKESFDLIDWETNDIVVSRGSFLETFGYQNQLSDWPLEDTKQMITLFHKQIRFQKPNLSIVFTEKYETAEQRAGKNFEYKDKKIKYEQDSQSFLKIKEHPVVKNLGIHIINIEVNSRDPWEVFEKDIKPILYPIK